MADGPGSKMRPSGGWGMRFGGKIRLLTWLVPLAVILTMYQNCGRVSPKDARKFPPTSSFESAKRLSLTSGNCAPGQIAYFYRGARANGAAISIDGMDYGDTGVKITRDLQTGDGDQSQVVEYPFKQAFVFAPLTELPSGCNTFEVKLWAAGGSVGNWTYKSGRGGGG